MTEQPPTSPALAREPNGCGNGMFAGPPPDGYDAVDITLRVGSSLRCDPRDWNGTLVVVADGYITVDTALGGRAGFGPGAVLAFTEIDVVCTSANHADASLRLLRRTPGA